MRPVNITFTPHDVRSYMLLRVTLYMTGINRFVDHGNVIAVHGMSADDASALAELVEEEANVRGSIALEPRQRMA